MNYLHVAPVVRKVVGTRIERMKYDRLGFDQSKASSRLIVQKTPSSKASTKRRQVYLCQKPKRSWYLVQNRPRIGCSPPIELVDSERGRYFSLWYLHPDQRRRMKPVYWILAVSFPGLLPAKFATEGHCCNDLKPNDGRHQTRGLVSTMVSAEPCYLKHAPTHDSFEIRHLALCVEGQDRDGCRMDCVRGLLIALGSQVDSEGYYLRLYSVRSDV